MKKYKVFDSEAGWYRFCDTLDEAAEETDNHIAETNGTRAGRRMFLLHHRKMQRKAHDMGRNQGGLNQ